MFFTEIANKLYVPAVGAVEKFVLKRKSVTPFIGKIPRAEPSEKM